MRRGALKVKTKLQRVDVRGKMVHYVQNTAYARAGHVFSDQPRTVPLDHLTIEQAQQIREDPLLEVEEVEAQAQITSS